MFDFHPDRFKDYFCFNSWFLINFYVDAHGIPLRHAPGKTLWESQIPSFGTLGTERKIVGTVLISYIHTYNPGIFSFGTQIPGTKILGTGSPSHAHPWTPKADCSVGLELGQKSMGRGAIRILKIHNNRSLTVEYSVDTLTCMLNNEWFLINTTLSY